MQLLHGVSMLTMRETLRVLKKGGTFAIHDMMEPVRYGDMEKFVEELKAEGYEDIHLVPTADGLFMSKLESRVMTLHGSTLLMGRKWDLPILTLYGAM